MRNTTNYLPSGCVGPGDVSLLGNVGLRDIVLTPEGLLFVFNKSHPIATTTAAGAAVDCDIILHPYLWSLILPICTQLGFSPTCTWHDENQIAMIQLVETTVPPTLALKTTPLDSNSKTSTKGDGGIEMLAISNGTQMKVKVGEPFFSPISSNIVNIINVQQYCNNVQEQIVLDQKECIRSNPTNTLNQCRCMQKLVALHYKYEQNICIQRHSINAAMMLPITSFVNSLTCSPIPVLTSAYLNVPTSQILLSFDRTTHILRSNPLINNYVDGDTVACSQLLVSTASDLGNGNDYVGQNCRATVKQNVQKNTDAGAVMVDVVVLSLSSDATLLVGSHLTLRGGIFYGAEETVLDETLRADQTVVVLLEPTLFLALLVPVINLQAPQVLPLITFSCNCLLFDTTTTYFYWFFLQKHSE